MGIKKNYLFLFFCLFVFFPATVLGADHNYIPPVFPVRGREFWRQGKEIQEIKRLSDLVVKSNLPGTWLLQYDVLADQEVLNALPQNSEKGIFLEATRKLAEAGFVKYDWEHGNWSDANKVFLSGYTRDQRQRMIDTAFLAFKGKFGSYPKSYGAWYIDVWSMEYIR